VAVEGIRRTPVAGRAAAAAAAAAADNDVPERNIRRAPARRSLVRVRVK